MQSREDHIDNLLKSAIAIFEIKKVWFHIKGRIKPLEQFFKDNNSEKDEREIENILTIMDNNIAEFRRKLAVFCTEQAIDRLKIEEKAQKSSDFYLALVIELLRELRVMHNYRFVFMGISCHLETFAAKVNLLRYTGSILLCVAMCLFFVMLPAILLTQPLAIPAIASLFLVIMALTLLIGYCGAMIIENQMPFTAEDSRHPCLITQLFGQFQSIEDDNPGEFILRNSSLCNKESPYSDTF